MYTDVVNTEVLAEVISKVKEKLENLRSRLEFFKL